MKMKHWFCTIHKTEKRATVTMEHVMSVLEQHTAYFQDLGKQGKCLFAGPFVDQTTELGGGIYSFICETETEARNLADNDPLVKDGLYSYKMCEWRKVVPE